MSKNRKRNRKQSRRPQPRPSHKSNPKEIIVTPINGPMEALDVIFYRPGRCALCQHKADDLMIGITWLGSCSKQHYAAYFCPPCTLFRMALMTADQKADFYQNAELDMECELAQDAIAESEARR